MSNEKKPPAPLANLSDRQKERLRVVSGSIQIDKITVSHSIEERNRDGRKSSAFYSVTASRGSGAEVNFLGSPENSATGYSPEDARLARLLLSKHVVVSVYDDAVKRGLMPSSAAQEELRAILTNYDNGILRLLNTIEGS